MAHGSSVSETWKNVFGDMLRVLVFFSPLVLMAIVITQRTFRKCSVISEQNHDFV